MSHTENTTRKLYKIEKATLRTVLLIIITAVAVATKPKMCDNKKCQYEGVCTVVSGVFTCTCIGSTYFQGKYCNEMVDNCAANPCQNGATCTSAIGLYICAPCPSGYAGQRCSIRESTELFTKWHFLTNHLGHYGSEHKILSTVETLGNTAFTYEILTDTISIDGFETDFTDKSSRWYFSDNLIAVAHKMGLRHADKLPYHKGYYHVSKTKFWLEGSHVIKCSIYDTEMAKNLYVEHSFVVEILLPKNIDCMTHLEFAHCSNPLKPLFLDIARFNNFEPIIRRRCAKNSKMSFRWSVFNSIETVQLHDFGPTATTLLKVPPYRMWFNYHGEVMQSYLIRIEAQELVGRRTITNMARCYVFVVTKPVTAIIEGGEMREVSVSESFLLDGSKSRDFALSPQAKQDMTYSWDCTSIDDPDNTFCHHKIGKSNTFNIRFGQLQLGKTYAFTLNIGSKVNIFSTDNAKQTIKTVTEKPLYITINCIRNCEANKFVTGQLIHLQAHCFNCIGLQKLMVYAWYIDGSSIGDTKRLLYTAIDKSPLIVDLAISNGDRQGKASMKLLKNNSPSGGDCTIDPSNGIEYETEFHISCTNYKDDEQPLYYQFIAADFTLDRTNDPTAHVRLPQLSGLKVKICDYLFACTDKEIPVSVSATKMPTDVKALKEFLKKPENNLPRLFDNGDIERAILLINTLAKRGIQSVGMAVYVFDQMRSFELQTLLETEQMMQITKNLVASLQPLDNKKAGVIAKYFEKLSYGLDKVIHDGEVKELQSEPYIVFTNEITNLLATFSEKLEDIAEVQTIMMTQNIGTENVIEEKYTDFPKFDKTVLPRVENWLQASIQLHRCLHRIGVAATNMHEPTEEALLVDRNGVKMEILSFEDAQEQRIVKTQAEATSIIMLAELRQQLKSDHILLQVITLEQNPFWWYPNDHPLSTEIFYLSAFSRNADLNTNTQLRHHFQFRTKLSPPPSLFENSIEPLSGILKYPLEMPIFQVNLPANTVLVITFVQTSTNLCALLSLNIKPRGYMVRKCQFPVKSQSTLQLINEHRIQNKAYLAVLAADEAVSKATFKFMLTLRQCLSWSFKLHDPQWTSAGCHPTLDRRIDDTSLLCQCQHLSSFAGNVYPTSGEIVLGDRILLDYMPINGSMVAFYLLLTALFVGFLLLTYRHLKRDKQNLITDIKDFSVDKRADILVHISTGGQWNAGTTANVLLTFKTLYSFKKFIIYQDPDDPHLTQNSTRILKLSLSNDELVVPVVIYLSHDNAGRYPTWYCRSIQIYDVKNERRYNLKIERWIGQEDVLLTYSEYGEEALKKKSAFKNALERFYIKWFQFQPLCGPWTYADVDTMNRFERTCIWISKSSITICIAACYFGRTTVENYEAERERYYSLKFYALELLILCIICYLVGISVEVGFRIFLLKYQKKS